MNPETPQPSREEIEVRLTALLLGELPPAEAELLRWSIARDAELAKLHDRLKSTIGLVRETVTSPDDAATKASAPLKLSEERRQKLLAHFKTVSPREFATVPVKARRKMSWLVPLAAVLMIAGMLAVLLLPSLEKAERADLEAGTLSMSGKPHAQADRLEDLKENLKDMSTPALSGPKAELRTEGETNGIDNHAELAFVTGEANKSPVRAPVVSPIALPSDQSTAEMPSPQNTPAPMAGPIPSSNLATLNYDLAGRNNGAAVGGFGGGGAGGVGYKWNQGLSEGDAGAGRSAGNNRSGQVGEFKLDAPVSSGSDQLTPAQSANAQQYYRALNTDGTTTTTFAPAPDGAVAVLEPQAVRNGGTSSDRATVSGALPPVAIALPAAPASVSGSMYADGRDQGVVVNNASAPAADSFAIGGQPMANGAKQAQGLEEYQAEDARRRNQTGARFESATRGGAAAGSVGGPRQARQTPIVVTGLPAAPMVADNTPPPPPPDNTPLTATLAPNSIPSPAPSSMPAAMSPPASEMTFTPRLPQALADEDKIAPPPAPVDAPVPQPEMFTKDNVFSTFSLNVSDVSYKLAAASLENEVMPAPETIRSEEFLNAFNYRDPVPPAGTPVGFAWERAGDPFAHNRDFLRFSVTTAAQGREAGRPLNLVVLLDKSGSMERADRVAILQEALKVLAAQLQPHDRLSVVTFARTARLYADGVSGNHAGRVFGKVSKVTPQGGTNLEEAMNLAYATALRHYLAGGVNRVVLFTDGAANLGDVDPQHFKHKVETYRQQGVALDCFGIGWEDYNDDLLEELASHADGRYGFLNHPEEAATGFASQLAGALQVAAADVKVQVEFNPARVTAYRQMGYAKHQLTQAQFRDNTVNAAVIGAAESGNGLYTVQLNPQGEGPVATVRVRFHTPGRDDYQERSWLVPYTGTAVALDRASPAMRLAAVSASFAEWLEGSPYASEVTPDQLLKYLEGVPEVYGADARPKKLEWMIRQAKSILGKG